MFFNACEKRKTRIGISCRKTVPKGYYTCTLILPPLIYMCTVPIVWYLIVTCLCLLYSAFCFSNVPQRHLQNMEERYTMTTCFVCTVTLSKHSTTYSHYFELSILYTMQAQRSVLTPRSLDLRTLLGKEVIKLSSSRPQVCHISSLSELS